MTSVRGLAVFVQAVAAFAVVAGLWFLLPLGWFLVAGGLVTGALSVAVEVSERRRELAELGVTHGAR